MPYGSSTPESPNSSNKQVMFSWLQAELIPLGLFKSFLFNWKCICLNRCLTFSKLILNEGIKMTSPKDNILWKSCLGKKD